MKVKVTACVGKDLVPGDLFSTAGQAYWDMIDGSGSIGERVYVRTNEPTPANQSNEPVYKVEVMR